MATLDFSVHKGRAARKFDAPTPDLPEVIDTLVTLDYGEHFEIEAAPTAWWTWCLTQANGKRTHMGLRPLDSWWADGRIYAQVSD